jgi:hypothetical protein
MGPVLELFQNPWQMLKRFWSDRHYVRLWARDIQYYRACDFFNAACPPNDKKLARFTPNVPLSVAPIEPLVPHPLECVRQSPDIAC